MIPYGRQQISDEDVAAVAAVLRSDWLTQGPAVERFEQAVAGRCGARYAVAVSNATAALHLACMALDLGAGDTLWTSPNTFVASANCALYCGARVGFVDIDPASHNMSVSRLAARLEEAASSGTLPKVVVPVHFAGQPCDMARIRELGEQYGFAIVEDASHAIGARYQGTPVGACAFSDMTVFSFHPVKIVTSGEGGMILTNRRDLYERLLRLRSHGITRDPQQMDGTPDGPWSYQQVELGYNYRITDIQAALGASQLERLEQFVTRRNDLARRYQQLLAGLPLALPACAADRSSAWHLYVVRVLPDAGRDRGAVFAALRERDIGVNVHYIPVHTQPYYRRLGFRPGDYPEAERYYGEAISLPIYFGLSDAEQDTVVAALREALA